MEQVYLYDTTLRDGAQMEGISYTAEDKLKITLKLDELGVHFIEGGWPGSNPKDAAFFEKAKSVKLNNAKLVAFASTRRANVSAADDVSIQALVEAGTSHVCLVGKSWDIHVTHVLETTLEENLRMISDSVRYLKERGRTVFLDAEHFFDGYKANPSYAIQCLKAAEEAGAGCLVLCDTNGGVVTSEITEIVRAVKKETQVPLGIHVHNDCDLAVANSIAALEAGAVQVQGTVNGYGERCGNANLCSIISVLKLKYGIDCITNQQLAKLTEISNFVAETANLTPNLHQPFVGSSAFTHKAGLHVSALGKLEDSYQHVKPDLVGNHKRILVSELSGRANIVQKARELGIDMPMEGPKVMKVLEQVKQMENLGFQYDGAEASFELLVHRTREGYRKPFELVDFVVLVEKHRRPSAKGNGEDLLSEATVKVKVDHTVLHTAAEGNGPVNALDNALRKALVQFYPSLEVIKLLDYKVRILEGNEGTGSQVRVLIESGDGEDTWWTVGSSANIIEASWLALVDSLEYWLVKKGL